MDPTHDGALHHDPTSPADQAERPRPANPPPPFALSPSLSLSLSASPSPSPRPASPKLNLPDAKRQTPNANTSALNSLLLQSPLRATSSLPVPLSSPTLHRLSFAPWNTANSEHVSLQWLLLRRTCPWVKGSRLWLRRYSKCSLVGWKRRREEVLTTCLVGRFAWFSG